MADASTLSNLSIGPVNTLEPAGVNRAANMFGPRSVPPADAVGYSLKKTTVVDRLQYPGERPKFYMQIDVASYHRFDGNGGNLFTVARLEPEETIILPLPASLVDINQTTYDQMQLGTILGGAASVLAAMTNSVNGKEASVVNNSQAAAAGIATTAVGVAAAAIEAKTKIPVATLAGAGLSLAGYTPNQFITILLKGPAYKRHSFTWTVSPHNEREAQNLQDIFNLINNSRAPGITAGGALFTFPKVFRVSLRPNSKYMYKFKPAVCEAFTVDYAGGGVPAFFRANSSDGINAPAALQFRIDLLELEYWLAGNYSSSNDPFDTQRGETVKPPTGAAPPIFNPEGMPQP